MVAEALDIAKEKYFAILMDRASGGPVLVGSPKGGVDIEAVAEETPDLIFKVRANVWPAAEGRSFACVRVPARC